MRKKAKFIFIVSLLAVSFVYINLVVSSLAPNLPRPSQKAVLYSNQMRQDLKMTCHRAIKKAKNSIHLVMFGLTDPSITNILNKQSENNLDLKIFYDKRSSIDIDIKPHQLYRVKSKGLMHQKILVIDESLIFLGSANMTMSSLMMHDNLIVGFYSPEIAKFLCEKAPYSPGNISSMVAGQEVEVWLLPDFQNKALSKVKNLIDYARSSLEVAMFTFTHPILSDALINAKKRGVDVKVAIDYQSQKGASRKTIEKLKNENIDIFFNKEAKLCHHKYILIDEKTLICGSANWTRSAFNKNYDCFLILHNLDNDQKKFMKRLFKIIELESSLLK